MARRWFSFSTPTLPALALIAVASACSRTPAAGDRSPDELAAATSPGEGAASPGEGAASRDGRSAIELAELAVADVLADSDDQERRLAIVTELRRGAGPGLDALIAEYERRAPGLDAAEQAAWRGLIDEVAGQRDAIYGGMFWRRDLEGAKAEAAATGKPILSLRLLGELDSEFSCANSRMFRTLLYADPELANWLEHSFVLHWSSERPVPRIEIDFGDGRVVERTITGNSAHFVLDAQGRSLDVIPGLWASERFRSALERSLELHAALADTRSDADWAARLAEHHEARLDAAARELAGELRRIRGPGSPKPAEVRSWLATAPNEAGAPVPALEAVPMAVAKVKIEGPVLAAAPRQLGGVAPGQGADLRATGPGPADDLERLMIGTRITGTLALHRNSKAIIAGERPLEGLVEGAGARAEAAAGLERTLLASLRQDTAQNALELHPRVHAELARRARAGEALDFAAVDRWIYAELFQTPADDPWLGMIDPEIYTGLVRAGLAPN